jgi:hypothetical protein
MSGIEPWSPPAEISADGPDPIFAAIETHRAGLAAHEAAVGFGKKRWGRRSPPRWPVAIRDRMNAINAADDAAMAFFDIKPTTIAGASALLQYVTSQAEEVFPDNLVDDDEKVISFGRAIAGHVGDALGKITQPA